MKIALLVKGVSFVLIALLITLVGIYITKNKKQNMVDYEGLETIDYKLEDKNLKLLVADTPQKREKGLMHFRKLEGVDGMIFIFDKKQILHFWNKNTYMDLDLYWLDDDKVVAKSFLPSIEKSKTEATVTSPAVADKVIEIPTKND